jgi:hypothetical protein
MQRLVLSTACGALLLAAILAAISPASAVPAKPAGASASTATDLSAQRRGRRVPQLRVTPRRYPYRSSNLPYPVPYPVEFPGPGAVRQCVANYVQEFRPSGTVIVPRMRCWWARAGG